MSYLDPDGLPAAPSDRRPGPTDAGRDRWAPDEDADAWTNGSGLWSADDRGDGASGPAWTGGDTVRGRTDGETADHARDVTAADSTGDGTDSRVADPAADPAARPPGARGRRRARRAWPAFSGATGRAGRNLPAAIGVGVSLAAVVLLSLFVWRPAFVAVVAAASGVGIWEMARAVRRTGSRLPLPPLLGGGLLMSVLAWLAGTDGLTLGLLATMLAAAVWRLADGAAHYRRDLADTTLIAVYVPFLLGFALPLAEPEDGGWRVVVTLAAVVLSDTGGYAAGVFFGRRPMAPSISPKKSWEGFAGSVVASALGAAVLLWLLFDVAPWWGALFGAVLSVAAVVGDLTESMMKRDLGIKDMSDLLPGHGGLMDRLDSLLFAVPVAYLLLSLLAPPG